MDRPLSDPGLVEATHNSEVLNLKKFARETFPGRHVDCFADLGEPGNVIQTVVQHQGTDLVMLATHGRGAVRRFLLGSVAAKVLHDCSAAVWTSTESAMNANASPACKSILCAVDSSGESDAVLAFAAAFSSACHASLRLVHVVEMPSSSLDVRFITDAAATRIREMKAALNIDAPHIVLQGAASVNICEEARRHNCDLIVAGRGHWQMILSDLWSRLYHIVRESPCPVLSI